MSAWDSYIDNLIEQSKDESGQAHIDKACIIGLDGGGKWTSDRGKFPYNPIHLLCMQNH